MATTQKTGKKGADKGPVLDRYVAPWMVVAKAELGKHICELSANDAFITEMRTALNVDSAMRALEQKVAGFGSDSVLLSQGTDSLGAGHYKLFSKQLPNAAQQAIGNMEAQRLKERNPEINKYFDGMKTDPAYDKKRRSFDITSTYESGGHGEITAWCAAFVNWCLSQTGVPHLGYATAKSWLEFGTPVTHPVYGCVTIIKPSSSTGSTTGHVAFFVEYRGDRVVLLGGNQGDKVSQVSYKGSTVLGYRWPTDMLFYLLAYGTEDFCLRP